MNTIDICFKVLLYKWNIITCNAIGGRIKYHVSNLYWRKKRVTCLNGILRTPFCSVSQLLTKCAFAWGCLRVFFFFYMSRGIVHGSVSLWKMCKQYFTFKKYFVTVSILLFKGFFLFGFLIFLVQKCSYTSMFK